MITLILAMDENRLIGRDGQLPWRVDRELLHFRRTTCGHVVIMGRKTWMSICLRGGQPFLPGRVNFVLTRQPEHWNRKVSPIADPRSGPHFVRDLPEAIEQARLNFPDFSTEIFIAGGGEIYAQALREQIPDRLLISHIHGQFQGDVFFPPLGPQWRPKILQRNEEFDVIEYGK